MSNYNAEKNRIVWVDVPVADLDRAIAFYSAVLGVKVSKESMPGVSFGLFFHGDGNGGCLVVEEKAIAGDRGILVYMNVGGRIRDAVQKVSQSGGTIIQDIHAIGPHGFRAIVRDSEGNRIALHSEKDA
jgi:predicted enzyme related to lactoylglutathione lyase